MATHRAITQCFHGAHLYEVGEEATFNPGEAVPEHFERIDGQADAEDASAAPAKNGRKKSADAE